MIRKIIGKIVETILPPPAKASTDEAQKQAADASAPKVKAISLEELLGGGELAKEPDLRVIGLYSSVEDEKIAELTVIQNRQDAYDTITDQLDKMYHDITAGKLDETGEWYKAVKKVKDDNPK